MNQKDIKNVEDFLKTNKAAKSIQKSFDTMKDKLTEYDKYKIIKEDLGESQYAKIFDTAIKNVELEKELEFSQKKDNTVSNAQTHWIGAIAMMYLFGNLLVGETNNTELKKLSENQKVIMQKSNMKDK